MFILLSYFLVEILWAEYYLFLRTFPISPGKVKPPPPPPPSQGLLKRLHVVYLLIHAGKPPTLPFTAYAVVFSCLIWEGIFLLPGFIVFV